MRNIVAHVVGLLAAVLVVGLTLSVVGTVLPDPAEQHHYTLLVLRPGDITPWAVP